MSNFNPDYFKDPVTGGFRFPAYTTNWKGLVQIRDLTPYKKQCFKNLSQESIEDFDLKQFESRPIEFVFEVESLDKFILRFPPDCFIAGVSGKTLDFLFSIHRDFVAQHKKNIGDEVDYTMTEMKGALTAGLMELAEDIEEEEENSYWFTNTQMENFILSQSALFTAEKREGIQQVIKDSRQEPEIMMKPTVLLREVYLDFVNLYVEDIKKHTLHFHPRILKELWKKIGEENSDSNIPAIVKQILKDPYWLKKDEGNTVVPSLVSNTVFSFQSPLPSGELKFRKKSIDPNTVSHKITYLKAKPGTYDESFLVNGDKFCFPEYIDNGKALVFFEDKTKYKKQYATVLSKQKADDFSVDALERNFIPPQWEVREVGDFLEDLPQKYMKEGITGTRLSDYLRAYYSLLNPNEEDREVQFVMSSGDPFVKYGYFELADQEKFNRIQGWINMPEDSFSETVLKNGIKLGKDKIKNIFNLVDKNVPFPMRWYRPTDELLGYFEQLLDLYIEDLKTHTNYFHPLYLESLWTHILEENQDRCISDRVVGILANPYWEERLYEADL